MAIVTTQKAKMSTPQAKRQELTGIVSSMIKQVDGHPKLKKLKPGLLNLKRTIEDATTTVRIREVQAYVKEFQALIKNGKEHTKVRSFIPLVEDASVLLSPSQAAKLRR